MKLRKIRKFVGRHRKLLGIFLLAYLILPIICTTVAYAQAIPVPTVEFGIGDAQNPEDVSVGLQILLLLTLLTLAPSILIMMTSFTRIIIILSLTRSALGTQQMPPNQVLVGLALFLTFFVMSPVLKDINEQALQPYLDKQITFQDALKKAETPMREFLFNQTRKRDLALFVSIADIEKPVAKEDVPTWVLIPAFIISELKTAFQMGFVIYIPFLIIDMVVASTLMSMGMLMLPPIIISLPFKILLFILVDGWYLITRSMVLSFNF
jgi:flagellar biosynthetic protein FliP